MSFLIGLIVDGCAHSHVQAEATSPAQHVVSGQVTATDLSQAGEGLPPMQDPPVIHEYHLQRQPSV